MKKILLATLICLGGAMILFAGAAAAQDPTVAGTIITSEGFDSYINYKDTALNPKATIFGNTLEATVLPIYGMALPSTPADQYTEPSVAVYYIYQVFNEGNDTDVFSLSLSDITYEGEAGDAWTFQIIRDDNQNGIVDDTDTVTDEALVSESGAVYFFVKVTPSSNAQDGSNATFTVTATTDSTPVGEYTGVNGNTYGGPAYVTDEATTYIYAPTISMTRAVTVNAPGGYIGAGGNANAAVPGAVITYTITYTNEGQASASDVIIKEKVPHYPTTEAGHVNFTGQFEDDVVNITAPQSTAATTEGYWFVYYSTVEAPAPAGYDGAGATHGDWILLGPLTSESVSKWYFRTDPSLPYSARWIKWETATVEAEVSDKTLTWGVIIR